MASHLPCVVTEPSQLRGCVFLCTLPNHSGKKKKKAALVQVVNCYLLSPHSMGSAVILTAVSSMGTSPALGNLAHQIPEQANSTHGSSEVVVRDEKETQARETQAGRPTALMTYPWSATWCSCSTEPGRGSLIPAR